MKFKMPELENKVSSISSSESSAIVVTIIGVIIIL
jgi:hypothetical protein